MGAQTPGPKKKKKKFILGIICLLILSLGLSLPKPWPLPLTAQTTQFKRKFKTLPQLQLIVIYKSNSGGKKRGGESRERETERWSDKYVCRER